MPKGVYERRPGLNRNRSKRPVIDRLLAKIVVDEDGCWVWTGYVMPNGYGTIGVGRRADGKALVHRIAYEHFVGPIPAGLDLDHNCHNADAECVGGWSSMHRRCCNPWHLAPATRRENLAHGRERGGR